MDAEALSFPARTYDAVLCALGLMYVPDPVRALREMHRVLAPSGRLALCVCRPIEHAAGYLPLARGLGRHAGAEAEAMMRSPFPGWSVEDLRGLVASAGRAALGSATVAAHPAAIANHVRCLDNMSFIASSAPPKTALC